MTLIGVKSKYGSCKGTCMGWIIINKKKSVYKYTLSLLWNVVL